MMNLLIIRLVKFLAFIFIFIFQEVKKQRLIYAGHCLHDDHTLKSVFELRPIDDGNVHVIHLVCPPRDFNTHAGTSLLRRRTANHAE